MNWRYGCLAWIAAGVVSSAATSVPPAADMGEVAVMRRTLLVADPCPAPLPTARRGEIFMRAGETHEGYLVVCLDEAGEPRAALLPFRTEWGRVTARSSDHDLSLPADTVRVLDDAALRPGACLLSAGRDYPVVSTSATAVTIRYDVGELSRELALARSQATVRKAPQPEALGMEDRLQAALEKSDALQRDLQDRLRESELRREKLNSLLTRLRLDDVENTRLAAEVARSAAAYRLLSQWKPQDPKALDTLKKALADAIRSRAEVEAGLQAAAIEIEPLRELTSRLLEMESDTHGLRADLAGRQTEADTLIANRRGEDAAASRTELLAFLNRARQERSDVTGTLTQTEIDRLDGSLLFDQLKTIKAENARLNGRIADLLTQLAELREALETPDPGAPAPAAPAVP